MSENIFDVARFPMDTLWKVSCKMFQVEYFFLMKNKNKNMDMIFCECITSTNIFKNRQTRQTIFFFFIFTFASSFYMEYQ